MSELPSPAEIVGFWRDAGHDRWFGEDPAFDAELRTRFEAAHHAAARRELDPWSRAPESALALLLLLDQVPRNIYRGSAHSYATDPLARWHADRIVAAGLDQAIEPALRVFCYLPFEHSEAEADQDRAVALYEALGDAEALAWGVKHRDCIARFGRFPHRNAALGRPSTAEEAGYLADGGLFGDAG